MTKFVDTPWSKPTGLSPTDYCNCCVIDDNPPGREKQIGSCHLPIRSTPGGPVNKGAIRNALARISQVKGVSPDKIASARKRLESLAREAGIGETKKDSPTVTDVHVDTPMKPSTMNRRKLKRLLGLLKLLEDHESKTLDQAVAEVGKSWQAPIVKADLEKQVVWGVVLRPNVVDSQGDVADEQSVASAAWSFMEKSRKLDYQHEYELDSRKAWVVESSVALFDWPDMPVKKGDWVMATKVADPQLWNAVKSGATLGAYSIRGYGKREKVAGA